MHETLEVEIFSIYDATILRQFTLLAIGPNISLYSFPPPDLRQANVLLIM